MKKSIKKLISVITATIAVGTMLVGCGGTNSTNSGEQGNVTLTYAIWDKNQEPGMRAMADAFEEKNPGIKVNIEVTAWDQYWTKLDAAASGGSLPDVFWMHPNQAARYASNSVLMDLTDKIKGSSLVDLDKFPKDIVNVYENDGKVYGIPKDFDTIALWYNKTLFDEAGVAYPNENWTWDDLLKAAKKLTNPEKGVYGFGAPEDLQQGFDSFIFQNRGKVLSDDKTKSCLDTEETKEAIQWYADLSLKEKVSPTQKQFSENVYTSFFESGKTAMGLFGSWMLSEFGDNEYVAKNCDVAVLPQGKQRATIINGLANAVAATTPHKEEAWKFVEFLGSEEANKIQAESGVAIPAYQGTTDAWAKTQTKFNSKVYVDMLSYAHINPYSRETDKWQTAEKEALLKAFTGESSVSDACDEAAKKVNEILASEK
ncbi:ABC transporter substrate-binding protein [Clostridium saccharobutylicum]|uniref:Putative ABC transporter substrate-binding protein YesO n=1 Tax=Clostridium saccharobutylicum TaxID=169679 RepID=A0A1S8MQ92_CLOSA|nr:sugar ABC transporter substrate-binding protein [Clostridium saccharobutylicum]OOM06362.1 putative ABC transporter substrate-binding protein YesO [Clostridium saccharobutylicum]